MHRANDFLAAGQRRVAQFPGQPDIAGRVIGEADDAGVILGLAADMSQLELFQADGDPVWLEWARALDARLHDRFWDEAEAGWFSTTRNGGSFP
mgnify:CR=1 FL=1